MMSKSNLIPFPTTAVKPKTNKILVIFEPTIVPGIISEELLKTDATEVANSGIDVPNATIVTPIINGEIPYESPIFSAASINLSDASKSTVKLTANMANDMSKKRF